MGVQTPASQDLRTYHLLDAQYLEIPLLCRRDLASAVIVDLRSCSWLGRGKAWPCGSVAAAVRRDVSLCPSRPALGGGDRECWED
jgi:hypothetical protein